MVHQNKSTKVLLLEGIHPSAKKNFESEGFEVQLEKTAFSEEDLIRELKNYEMVGIRSKSQITQKVLKENSHLLAVGAFCIGTNQIDTETSNVLAIPVFNAPYSNTRSVAELVIAEMIALSRKLGDINMKAHQGEWMKSAVGNFEVRNKTLGIIGYGHIGSQVSVLAEGMGMKVIYHDIVKKLPLGNAQPAESLKSLLEQSDFVTLHVPATPQTHEMMGDAELKSMKPGSFLVNASRGTVVKISELAKFIKEGHISGAAIDVFPEEPKNNSESFMSELQGLSNVILTPHIGGSTEEAQANIGSEVSTSLIQYFKSGASGGAVNFPNVDLPVLDGEVRRVLNIHKNVPGVLSEINSIVSSEGANISAQYLSTDAQIGFLVMDMEDHHAQVVAQKIHQLETSIKTRIVF